VPPFRDTRLEAELFGFEAGAFSEARRAKPRLFEAASCKAYGAKAKRMRWPSAHPVFNAESRDFAEVSEIAGEEYGVVSEGDGSDLQVHCADADPRCP